MKIALLQINSVVGDFQGNQNRILTAYRKAVGQGAELVLTSELALPGTFPQDLIFHPHFVTNELQALEALEKEIGEIPLIVGFIDRDAQVSSVFYNAAAVLQKNKSRKVFHKTQLTNCDVFDESRYFSPAKKTLSSVTIHGQTVGIAIGDTIFDSSLMQSCCEQNIALLLHLTATPFALGESPRRFAQLRTIAEQSGKTIVSCNALGGNDQLIFAGGSIAISAGNLLAQLPEFTESVTTIDTTANSQMEYTSLETSEQLRRALVLGISDYCKKCGFDRAILGLSGGIDSALVAALAVEALGADNVLGVTMPSHVSSEGSIEDSLALANNLGIRCLQIPIGSVFESFRQSLQPFFKGLPEDTTEENLQPRIRATLLMALSNKYGNLLLTTGNKSEFAMGYCTLYGDMAGGLAVLSDLTKTRVYQLARHLNREREIIPHSTIEKPPSAELKPGQKDEDSLPPYPVLDAVLELYIEQQKSASEIIAQGFPSEIVHRIIHQTAFNEYKRKQAAPGLRVTRKAFGTGRRIPIARRFSEV